MGRRDPLRLLSLPVYGRAAAPMIAFPESSHAITKFCGFQSDGYLPSSEVLMKHTASVTSLFPVEASGPDLVASELVAILPRAQLAKSYEFQLSHLAGPLYPRVQRVFGGAHAPLYLLTDRTRRSVWNAVLAAHHPAGDMRQLRTQLLETKSGTLLKQAFGGLPRGFLTILKKSGETGLDPDFYHFWHRYLTDHPEDFPVVAARGIFDAKLTDHMRGLPPALARLPIVGRFQSKEVRRLVEVMTWMHGGRPDPAIWADLAIRLIAGENPLNILTKITDKLTFPSPYITGDHRFRHISSIRDLKQTAMRFENCLGEPHSLQAGLRGYLQFYEYHDGKDLLVVSISAEPPFGFMVSDILLKDNELPEQAQLDRITKALAEHAVIERRSVLGVIRDWDLPDHDEDIFAPDF